MGNTENKKTRNDRIAEMLARGEGLKDFYRFTAQNPHIDLHDACQIVLYRPKASICFYIDEWNEMGRRVTKSRKGIPFYDTDGTKQIVFDLHDTHGDKRYRRLIFPMRRLLYGLDELNGTQLAESNRRDYSKILTGVAAYLEANGYFTEDEQRNGLLSEGVAYSLYSKTGFPKTSGIALRGMPYGLDENARLFKEIYLLTEFAKDDISSAYDRLIRTPKILNDIEEETVSDEPVIQDQPEPALSEEYEEPAATEKPAEQEITEPEDAFEEEEEPEPYVNPLYARYRAAEQEKPESVVLIRVGDFYEVFGDRAKETADLLNLTLTSRDVGLPERIPMCGFPWHVTEQYMEKILEHRSVCILEPDSEPVYISSHAKDETREPSQPTEPVAEASEEPIFDAAELTELEEIMLSEFSFEQADHTIDEDESAEDLEDAAPEDEQDVDAEELLGEIFDEEETEEEPEPSEEPTPTTPSPRSGGRGIRDRKRKNNPQISMFDMPDGKPKKSREEEIVDYCLKDEHSDYKIAYYDAYEKNLSISEFVKLFKRHYGEYSGQSDGEKSITNTTKGRKIEWRDKEHPENNLTVQLKWPEVAVRIAELIENDDYLTPNEKKEYARIVRFREARENAKTDGERCKVIADQIVEYGTHKTYSEVFSEYPHFLEDHAQFYFDHREEIKRELLTRKEVKSVEDKRDMFDDNISVSFYIKYCPRWQESLRRRLMREHRVQDYADEFIEECANNYETAPDGETIEWTITPKETGELNYLFIKDYRDEFIKYLQSKAGVKSAKFSMERIEITFDRDYIAGIADGELLPPIQQTRRVREIADRIIREGVKNTTEGNWVHFFDEFGEDETFARENAEEIAAELERHQEVSDVELTPDAFDTNFYLDYCPNYIPEEDETGYENEDQAEEEPAAQETEPKPTHNRFTELTPEERSYYESYIQRPYREPTYSPWEEVQDCTVIAPGIYSVSTAGHGGVMITAELAPHILSPEAVAEGDRDGWYYCYEEDVAICIPLRELYDKGILGETYFSCNYFKTDREDAKGKYILYTSLTDEEKEKAIASWDKTLNESLAHWYPEYWQAYLQAKAKTQRKDKTDLNAVLDQSELGGAKTRFKNNIAAIRLAKFLYARNAAATDEEKRILAKYVGWGGLAQAFDETNKQWQKEYAELKNLLSDAEYSAAKGSVLNAHYTSKEIIDGIYSALKRFGVKGSNRILEPALGTGNFFGYMPQEIAAGANLYGVELDTVTGMIATELYPQANVQIKGFEDTSYPDDYFDIAVSNVPFGGYGVYDSEYTRHKFLIHDYFIAKSIDKVKPGGVVAVITSKGTLDKLNPTARKYMAERAELLGAIRLPNTAFKQTANTEAVADILFFQKRGERLTDTSGIAWLGTGKTEDGFEVNNYFLSHPEMVLGMFAQETGLYGAEGLTVKPDGRDLGEAIKSAIENLPQNIYSNSDRSQETTEEKTGAAVFNIRPMCYAAIRGKLYMRMGERLEEQEIPKHPKDAYDRIKGMIELRDELRRVLEMQSKGCTDEELARAQRTLNAKYDVFVKKYGLLNSQTNTRLFREDGDAALVFACEKLSEDKTRATKADVFTKRTIRLYTVPTQTGSAAEALQICRNERGSVDISYIEELTGKNFETVVYELGNLIYRDPRCADEKDKYTGYVTAEEYLSGKVVEKLRIAKVYAENHPEYLRNVEALEKVQPEPLKANDISVRIGASWVKPEYYKQFLLELLKIDRYFSTGLTVRYNEYDNAWSVERMEYVRKNAGYLATETYGTNRANAFRLFEDCLNQRATSIYDTERLPDGKDHQVLNQAETIAAREKQNKIKEEFADWIYADPKRREDLEKTYNALFNQIRLPSYDGSYLKFPGMNPGIELRPHQKNAVARIAGTGDSTLLHHVVGSGKSYTMAASAMKLRQYGLAKKPMIVVPNHLVQQMANEFRTLYPTSKLLVAEKEDLEKNKRRQFVSKAAMGDWDSIIIAQSSFAKIPVSQERQKRKIEEEIQRIENSIQELQDKRGVRTAVKDLERIKKNKTAQLKKLTDSGKKDNVLIFENLGVDYLFVDEADAYKNLFLFTKMNNVSGISKAASARASDLQLKIEYINELHGGDKGVVFATGTPISNSMAEMYIMQTYLQKNTLRELGIDYFDGWAANFGETVTALEMAPSGQGYRARTRFAKFTNLPELMTLYRSFADVQTSETVKLDVPEAERETVTLEPSAQTIEIAEAIAARAERIYRGGVDPHMDNMLKVTSDGKKLALDIRCFDPILTDEQTGKADVCADNVYRIYKETSDIRGTQLIFCDLSTPKKAYENYEYGKDFDVYNDLKHKLIERGVPESEIVFIHDAKTDKDKQALFDKMNEGKIRVLIGSTEKCGAGTNVQKRLAALHHLDAPYRPRDLQQRDGRGIRQGNLNKQVKIFTYVTKRTLDSYCYQILENKQRFISQIENGSLTVREAEDIDEKTLSYAEIKAITAANPKIKRKTELESELSRLRILEGQYKKNKYSLQDKIIKDLPAKIREEEQRLAEVMADEKDIRANYDQEVFKIEVLGKEYTDKAAGGEALLSAVQMKAYGMRVAEFAGLKISVVAPNTYTREPRLQLEDHCKYEISMSESGTGLITRLLNFINTFSEKKTFYENNLAQYRRNLAVAEEELQKPFEHKEKIAEITKELSEINAELDLNKREEVVIESGEEDEPEAEAVNYMGLPGMEEKQPNPEKRSHRRMTEKLYRLYTESKAEKPDAVIFLKNGEYYETCGDDANTAAFVYGAVTYDKELAGERRSVAMLTYDDLNAMINDLSEENRRYEILEPENEIDSEVDFLETENEMQAIAEKTAEEIDFEDWEELSQLTKDYIDERWKMQKAKTEGVPLYSGTLESAKANGEENLYRQSLRANIECKHEIDQAVNKNFDGYRLNKGFEQDLLDRFGMERVKYVLANAVQGQAWDGRYSPETKEWSNTVTIAEEKEHRHQFELTSHPAVLDGFIARIRAAEKEMQQKKGEEVQEKDYRTETAKGLPVVHIEKDKYGHDIAIVKRQKDYVVAIGYDVKEGTWEQGRYDFPTQAAAQEYIDEKYKPQTQDTPKWLTAKVSRDALIRRYDKHSFMRMPNGEYENYTYNIYNSRIKESRQLVDMESDGRELCYELIFPADEEIVIKNRDGDEAIFTAEEFTEYIGGTSNADYERKEQSDDTTWYSVSVPQEALRGSYDRSSLFAMPTKGDFSGYSYYIPNVFIEEDKRGESGNILITLPEDFDVTLRNRETGEEVIVTSFDLFTECNETKGEDYSRAMSEPGEIKKIQTIIPEKAKIAEYKTHTLFKMPDTGEYAGYCFYLFNDQIRAGETGIEVNLAEDFTVNLKNRSNDKNAQLTSGEFKAIMEKCKPEDFRLLKKPSAEHAEKFKKAEALYRKNLPPEMLARPNWVMVWTRKNEEKNRLDKFLISPVTDKFAEIDDPSTWVDFETACKYARENDGEALAYALDGKDKICCIDLDHCFNEKGQLSSTAQEAWKACGETYREVSVSKNGLHIFGKTDGMDLRVYAKDGDLEFYQKSHFITLTGNSFNSWKGLQNFDELPIKEYLEQKCEKRTAWQGAGQGIEGLSMLSDREVVERACAAKNGATFRAYYEGKDLRNNHSNSDMAFMIFLAFWCNGDINQMLRINATSGLYRPEKSPEYYEYTAMKAIRENPERFKPREKESDKTPRAKEDADKGGK